VGVRCASAVGIRLGGSLNPAILMILMIIVGGIGAGLIGALCAFLKVKLGTNETLMTLMFNYIALYLLKFFAETKAGWNFFLDPASERPKFLTFPDNAWMPTISFGKFSLNISLIVAILIFVLVHIYLNKTKHGYEIAVVGDSINTARYSGMKVGKIIVRTVFISAFLIGGAGAMHVSSAHIMSTSITNDVGWTGVIVAWLSKLNPAVICVVSVLITVLQFGCQAASAEFSAVDDNFANLLQGIILFSILAADFLVRFKVVRYKAAKEEN
ncbi:MAG: ABC transporter permease, partial [Lachnospiraceae bacterium]|nr:ABC transporter permease [Lachnospiraceae bacterium]